MKKFVNFIAIVTIALAPASIAFGADVGTRIDTANILQNYLSTDGCEHTVVIHWQEYALDYTSYSALKNAFLKRTENIGMIRQRFTYDFTGITWKVNCGRGTKSLPQIKIYSYIPKYTVATFAKLLPNEFDTNLYGCKHSVQIGATTYALNPASYATVENMFLNAYNPNATIYKSIRYRLTGNDGTVVCGGWESKVLQEISIGSIY